MPHWLRRAPGEPPMSARTRGLVFLESFLGNFLFSICMLFGVSLTSAVSAGVIMASIPAAVAVASWLFLRERITVRIGLAIACAAFGIGLLAGRAGDALSLGFVVETERQVEQHLDGHLDRLPAGDLRSRSIVQQMKEDEAQHAAAAQLAGAAELPSPIRWAGKRRTTWMGAGDPPVHR
jgi:hypothetical protein